MIWPREKFFDRMGFKYKKDFKQIFIDNRLIVEFI